ncbi:hypothetical protein D3C84_957910 [compost metagenome]
MYSGAGTNGLLSRHASAGFGNRIQFGTIFAQLADCWNIAATKASTTDVLNRYALVCKDGQITAFRNGIKQLLANGTGSTYNTASIPSTGLTDLRAIRLGWLNSTVVARIGRHGRIRITAEALYTDDYTPEAF